MKRRLRLYESDLAWRLRGGRRTSSKTWADPWDLRAEKCAKVVRATYETFRGIGNEGGGSGGRMRLAEAERRVSNFVVSPSYTARRVPPLGFARVKCKIENPSCASDPVPELPRDSDRRMLHGNIAFRDCFRLSRYSLGGRDLRSYARLTGFP